MGREAPQQPAAIDRRRFLLGAGVGLAAGAGLSAGGWGAWQQWLAGQPNGFTVQSAAERQSSDSMPGRYPGRVVEIRHPGAVSATHEVRAGAVKTMMDQGMIDLTGAEHPREAWAQFFEPGDVVGVKVNPVGYQRRPDAVGAISNPAVLLEVVSNLKSVGVKPRDIIVFERYANEFREAGYEAVLRERVMDGVRWYASGSGYDPGQMDIRGYDSSAQQRERDPHVVGYDPDVFVEMAFADRGFEKDERRYRSHLSMIVTRMINKLITIPVLKDHRSAGVTLALKNLSHGLNNNVARSHLSRFNRIGDAVSDPNQCNTFIPMAAGQLPIRRKATLHILDGLIGVYEGGPGSWNTTWGTWRRQSLFFATDPVALDHVGWDVIDAERARRGWQPVACMGKVYHTPAAMLSRRLGALIAHEPAGAVSLLAAGGEPRGTQEKEDFDRRQPEHIVLAGTIGLGIFDARQIQHRVCHLPA